MLDNVFAPQTLTIDAGTVVRWVNDGRNKHNVIVDIKERGDDWSSRSIRAGHEFEHQFLRPGVYGYSCTFHGAPNAEMYDMRPSAVGTPSPASSRTGCPIASREKSCR